MALVVTHGFSSAIADDPVASAAGEVLPSHWNANHTLTGVVAPDQGGTGVANNAASTLTISGNFATTLTVTAGTTLTLPTSGTLAVLASPAFTGVPTAPTATAGTNTTQIATTAFVLANGAGLTNFSSNGTTLSGSGQTVTANAPILDLTQTWNATASAFTAIKLNVTNTASLAGSLLADLQVGGSSMFKVDKTGAVTAASITGIHTLGYGKHDAGAYGEYTIGHKDLAAFTTNFAFTQNSTGDTVFNGTTVQFRLGNSSKAVLSSAGFATLQLGFAANAAGLTAPDIILERGAAGILEQRSGTNSQSFRVYNTYTDSLTFERGVFDWTTTANTLTIGTQAGASGGSNRYPSYVSATGYSYMPGQLFVNYVSGTAANALSGTPDWVIQTYSSGIQITCASSTHGLIISAAIGGIQTGSTTPLGWSSGSAGGANSDVAIVRAAAGVLEVNNATASGAGYIRLNGVGVGSLPAASATYRGCHGTVTNSTAALTAGIGAVVASATSTASGDIVPVFCDGTNWRIG